MLHSRVALRFRGRHCRSSGSCARLRSNDRSEGRERFARGRFCLQGSILFCLRGRHKRLVRAQCLTSAAFCRCSHPNSYALDSPIPNSLLPLARQPLDPRQSISGLAPDNLLTLRHLFIASCSLETGLAAPAYANYCVPFLDVLVCPKNASSSSGQNRVKTEMSRKDAQRLS